MSVIIDGTKGTTTPGLYSSTTFTGTYADGIVVDYTTGLGRISVGTSDGLAFYNAGVANTELMRLDSSGYLGIGTSSPSNRLTVSSPLTGTTPRSNSVIRVQSEASGRDVNIQLSDNVSYSAEVGMVSGNMYFATTGAERMRIDSSGNLLVGTTTAAARITQRYDVSGESAALSLSNSDQRFTISNYYQSGVGQYTLIAATNAAYTGYSGMYLRASQLYQQNGVGTYLVTTAGGSTSDASVKTNLVRITDALSKICALNGYSFDFTEEYKKSVADDTVQKRQIGIVAQEVEVHFPEVVNGDGEIKSVNYEKLVAPLIEAIKEQQAIIEQLRADVEQLKG